jgi:hypothetical protein
MHGIRHAEQIRIHHRQLQRPTPTKRAVTAIHRSTAFTTTRRDEVLSQEEGGQQIAKGMDAFRLRIGGADKWYPLMDQKAGAFGERVQCL